MRSQRNILNRLFFTIPALLWFSTSTGQTVIRGTVSDASTGESLPYVNVVVFGSSEGTVTDFDGHFSLTLRTEADSFMVSYVGYIDEIRSIESGKTNQYDIMLKPDDNILGVVEVRPGVNPALRIIKNAQKNRSEYNIDKVEHYEYESYNKVQLAVDNISDNFKKRKLFQEVAPLFDTISVLTPDSTVPVLPVFISETLSDYYFRKTPRRTKEVIHASRVTGVGVGDESYVSQLLGSTFQQYNFYDNNLYILDKDFISPISTQAQSYYGYMLVDSMYIGKDWCYQIQVFPRNKFDLVFSGMIWITDSTFALKRLSLEITKQANINFVEKLKIQQELTEVSSGVWIPSKLRVLIDVAEPSNNALGMVGLYYSSNKNIKAGIEHPLKFYEEKVSMDIQARDFDQEFWDTSRHEVISDADIRIYSLVDSLKNQPIIKRYVNTIEIIAEGFKPVGKIDLGAYYYLLGYNELEGPRTRVGFRTNQKLSKRFYALTYGAYGFKDKQIKYGLRTGYILSMKKWSKVEFFTKRDVELIGLTDQDYGTSAMYDAFALLGTNRINRSTEYQLWGEREVFKGYIQRLSVRNRQLEFEPIGDFNFVYYTHPQLGNLSPMSSRFNLTNVTVEGVLSHKQQFVIRRHERMSLGHLKAPVITWSFTKGFEALNGDFEYEKVSFHVWQFNSLANLGTFEYNIWIGKTFGTLPYPVLEVMRGNQGYFSNKTFYNLMNFYEFVADQYIAGQYEHQFNGLIMNRIPLLRKWKWRSFVNAKAVWGSLSFDNYFLIPRFDGEGREVTSIGRFIGNRPYVEIGYGVENILRFIRIDFIHRLTYLGNPGAQPFGIKGNLVFRF